MSKTTLSITCIFVLLIFVGESNAAKHDKDAHWVGTWATSPQEIEPNSVPPSPGFADSTLRQVVHVSIGGKKLRVRFSNLFGATGLTIPSVHVALPAGDGIIRAGSDKALTFHGNASVTIPPGALMYSDPLDFDLAPLSNLVITMRLTGVPDAITSHFASHEISYLQAGDTVAAADMSNAVHVEHWYFINGVDVLADSSAAAIVTLGDSITDGSKSTTGANNRWPDELARRLQADVHTKNIAVLNEGIGGNRLIHDRSGKNALARFDGDVLAQSGVRWLIVLEGINDIGTRVRAKQQNEQAATADDLISAYEQIILRAHAHDIKVFGATILPYVGANYSTPDGEVDRQKVNQWIRTRGQFDGVIDLDAATRDAKDPSHLSAVADSGDHLHPADAGYKIMGSAVDLKLFRK